MDQSGDASLLDAACVLDALPDVLLAIDADARLVYANAAAERLGWDRASWITRPLLDLVHPDDLNLAVAALSTIHEKEVGSPIELRVRHPRDGWRWFEVVGTDRFADPELGVLLMACRDLTERRRWEVAQGNVARFQSLVQHAAAVTMLVDRDGRIDSVSGAVTRLLGYDPEFLAGTRLGDLAAPGYGPALEATLRSRRPNGTATVEVPVLPAGQQVARPYRFEVVDLCNDPVVSGYVVTAHDVSELHEAREELERLATHDALTGLPNRIALTERLSHALSARDPRSNVAVLFIDLDRFKPVNDLLGHEAGDELLVALADRLVEIVRDTDTVVRIGGDEFVIVATGLRSRAAAEQLAQRVEQTVAEPFALRAGVAHVTASVGVAVAERGATATGLLADADNAMYQVKYARRNATFSRARHVSERRRLAAALIGALDRDEIEAWFQPVVSVTDGHVLGFEALARWRRPNGEILVPGDFLDVAEEIGLTTAIDEAMLTQACRRLAGLTDIDPTTWVSVNLTASDLADPRLIALVTETLTSLGLDPSRLAIEVTEQAMLERPGVGDWSSPQSTLRELAAMGVRVVLDDFGTGYSSLTHVRHYHLNALKIDRSFVDRIAFDPADHSVVAAVVGLAHALGLSTVAEGVERREQLQTLRLLGCDAAQGFLFSPALAPDDVATWVREHAIDRAVR